MMAYLHGIAYEIPDRCPYCGRSRFGLPQMRSEKIARKCRNCGGWVFADLADHAQIAMNIKEETYETIRK